MKQPQTKQNRGRGKQGRKPSGSPISRVHESSGPEGRVRGTPQQIVEKYISLARDASTSGDRIVSENFLQHAEHYQRMIISAQEQMEERRRDNGAAAEGEGDNRRSARSGDDGRSAQRSGDNGRDARRAEPQRAEEARSAPEPQEAPQPEAVEAQDDALMVKTPEQLKAESRSDSAAPRRRARIRTATSEPTTPSALNGHDESAAAPEMTEPEAIAEEPKLETAEAEDAPKTPRRRASTARTKSTGATTRRRVTRKSAADAPKDTTAAASE